MTLEQVVTTLSELAPQVAKLTEAFAKLKPLEEAEHGVSLDKEGAAPAAAAPAAAAKPEDGGEGTPAGAGMDEAAFVKRIAKRDQLAKQISAHVGTFDHAEMTLDAVVKYGCDKLGLQAEAGQEAATLQGFLQAKPAATPAATVSGMDAAPAKAGNFVARHLKKGE